MQATAARCKVKGPGDDYDGDKADRQHDNDAANRRIAQPEYREQRFHDLNQQPADSDIRCNYAQDIASFEFGEQIHRQCGPLFMSLDHGGRERDCRLGHAGRFYWLR